MKIALVHDQLQEFGGAERVLVALHNIFPDAEVFTSFYNPQKLGIHKKLFENWKINTSWADKIPYMNNLYSPLRFITPWIWKGFDFSGYDLVVTSSGSYMSKGVVTKGKTINICYLHHPPRYLYGYETAIEWKKYLPIKIYGNIVNHYLRQWDYTSSQRVGYFISNSIETKKRTEKFYRRDSIVIYPPVSIPHKLSPSPFPLDPIYYITVSRLARAKHIEVLIKAANKMKFNLKIVGSGRDSEYLKSISGTTIEFLVNVTDDKLSKLYQQAKAFLFSAVDEEFGIAPVEAMGNGLPVIAYASGGLKETVKEGINGYLFDALNEDLIIEKINELASLSQNKYLQMRKNARKESEKYSFDQFQKNIVSFVNKHARTTRG